MATPEKTAAVAEIVEDFRTANATVLTEYRGLSVGLMKQLRRSLGVKNKYSVVKNTLTKIAAKEAGVDLDPALLAGPSAVAFIKGDPIDAAKALRDFAKENPLLVIKGGIFDGKAVTTAEIMQLANLESREVLLAKIAGAMKASMSKAARTFDALRIKMEAGAPAPVAAEVVAEGKLNRPPTPVLIPRVGVGIRRKGKNMAKLNTADLLGQFKDMSLVELTEFVKAFETEFDVTAAAPVAVAAAGGAAAGAADAAQDEFTIILEDAGSQKIAVIKEVRALNSSLGLKEAKDLVDATPATIMEKADKATADKAKAAFEAAGAKVTIK